MQPGRLKLDNPVFADALRHNRRSADYARRPAHPATIQDVAFVRARAVAPSRQAHPSTNQGIRLQNAEPSRRQTEPKKLAQAPVLSANNQATKPIRKRHSRRPHALYMLAIGLFIVGSYVAYDGWRANHKVAAQVEQLQKQTTKSEGSATDGTEAVVPSTDKPADAIVRNYAVAPNLPRYIDVPKLGVHARVMSLSVDRNNELQAPTNVHNAGWYNASAQPGQTGAMLVDGHSGIGNYKGVFHSIGSLVAGDVITITRGDGTRFNYQVVRTETVDEANVNMASMLVSADTAKPGLNLITCAGEQLPGTYQLAQRTLVYAVMP